MKDRRRKAKRRQDSEATQNKVIAAFADPSSTSKDWIQTANRYFTQRDYDAAIAIYERAGAEPRARLARAFKDKRTANSRLAYEGAVAALLTCAEETTGAESEETLVGILSELCDCYIDLNDIERAVLSLFYARNVSRARAADPFFLAKLKLVPLDTTEQLEDADKMQIMVIGGALEVTFDESFDTHMAKYEVGMRIEHDTGGGMLMGGCERLVQYRPVYVHTSAAADHVDDTRTARRASDTPVQHAYSQTAYSFLLLIAAAVFFIYYFS